MVKSISYPHLDAAVSVGLACVEQGLENRRDVRETILDYVAKHYMPLEPVARPEDIPVSVLDRLHMALGLCFEAHGGRLSGGVRYGE